MKILNAVLNKIKIMRKVLTAKNSASVDGSELISFQEKKAEVAQDDANNVFKILGISQEPKVDSTPE